jgi:shikimate dehydrogenase
MKINNATKVCISVAIRPGNFGAVLHNAGYQALDLNFVYIPFKVTDIKLAISAVRTLGIRGCSVTMPFKVKVIQYLDELDKTVSVVGAVNTIVNNRGKLVGYNTDVYGARKVLQELGVTSRDKVLLLGAGGAAKAISYALYQLGVRNVFLTNRTASKARIIAERLNYKILPWVKRNNFIADILINATVIGMSPQENKMPVSFFALKNYRAVMDVIVTPIYSRLIKESEVLKKKTMPGYKMSLHQAAAQFQLYTKKKAPLKVMQKAILFLL